MGEYKPTTEDVKNCYVFAGEWLDRSTVRPLRVLRREFDRWLLDNNRKIVASALRRAARELPFPQDPYGGLDRKSLRASQVQHGRWLRTLADRIEQGGES